MKTNTRYILTATGVAAGLFLVGATANALAADNTATSAPIGSGVVLPSASADPSATPSLVQVEYAENTDSNAAQIPATVVDTGGWGTGPATGAGGGVGDDDHEGVDD
jgi:type IV secretory pathway TrbL component